MCETIYLSIYLYRSLGVRHSRNALELWVEQVERGAGDMSERDVARSVARQPWLGVHVLAGWLG